MREFRARAYSILSWAVIAAVAIAIGGMLAFILYRQGIGAEEREQQQAEIAALQSAVDEANDRLQEGGEEPVEVPPVSQPEEGPAGAPGAQGPRGTAGVTGADGKDGKDGATGPTGPAGKDGRDGDDGSTGTAGTSGEDGSDGLNGLDGKPGPSGPPGPQGEPGEDGQDGSDGVDGKDGADGKDGEQGPPGPTCTDTETPTTIWVMTAGDPSVNPMKGTWAEATICVTGSTALSE